MVVPLSTLQAPLEIIELFLGCPSFTLSHITPSVDLEGQGKDKKTITLTLSLSHETSSISVATNSCMGHAR